MTDKHLAELREGIIRLLKAATAKDAREPLAYVADFEALFTTALAKQDRESRMQTYLLCIKTAEKLNLSTTGMLNAMKAEVKELARLTKQDKEELVMKKKYYLTDDQADSIVKLINEEMELNSQNNDNAYNTHWESIKMALGYAIIIH